MHQIRASHTIKLTLSQEVTDLEKVTDLLRTAESNRAKVIAGACSVEKDLTEIVAWYFHPEDFKKREELRAMILDSEWCSFGNKRKLIEKIILTKDLLQGEQFVRYQKLLADTMKFRNAFAHGQFQVNQQKISLSFYQDKPQTTELSDTYLKSVEQVLREANEETLRLVMRMGVRNVMTYGFDQSPEEEAT